MKPWGHTDLDSMSNQNLIILVSKWMFLPDIPFKCSRASVRGTTSQGAQPGRSYCRDNSQKGQICCALNVKNLLPSNFNYKYTLSLESTHTKAHANVVPDLSESKWASRFWWCGLSFVTVNITLQPLTVSTRPAPVNLQSQQQGLRMPQLPPRNWAPPHPWHWRTSAAYVAFPRWRGILVCSSHKSLVKVKMLRKWNQTYER